jgi:hypothetical protein
MNIRAGLGAIAVGAAMIGGVVSAKAVTYSLTPGSDMSQGAPEKALDILRVDPDQTGTVSSESLSGAVTAPLSLPAQSMLPATDGITDNPLNQGAAAPAIEALKKTPETVNPGSSR